MEKFKSITEQRQFIENLINGGVSMIEPMTLAFALFHLLSYLEEKEARDSNHERNVG